MINTTMLTVGIGKNLIYTPINKMGVTVSDP